MILETAISDISGLFCDQFGFDGTFRIAVEDQGLDAAVGRIERRRNGRARPRAGARVASYQMKGMRRYLILDRYSRYPGSLSDRNLSSSRSLRTMTNTR